MSPMSAPAAKTLGPPVRTTARTRSSASSSRRAWLTSPTSSGLRAFSTFGRSSVTVAIGASTSTVMNSYCMPAEGLKWLNREDLLRFEEITRLARIFVERYGVRTIRITGGEPLVRVKVEELVGMINDIDPTLDITMTTNGVLLREKAQLLKNAGLKRINISLD